MLFFFSFKLKNENTRVLLGTRVSKKKNSYSELGFKKTRTQTLVENISFETK